MAIVSCLHHLLCNILGIRTIAITNHGAIEETSRLHKKIFPFLSPCATIVIASQGHGGTAVIEMNSIDEIKEGISHH